MAFELWADEAMTTRFADAGNPRLLGVNFSANGQVQEFKFYFGNPSTSTKLEAADGGALTLSVADALPDRAPSTVYTDGEVVEPAGGNGFVYRCITGGTSGSAAPSWLTSVGSNTADGGVVWRCIGRRHTKTAAGLSLSQSGSYAQSVQLGSSIPAGVAVAVYLRLTNQVADLYQLLRVPQLALVLSDAVELSA